MVTSIRGMGIIKQDVYNMSNELLQKMQFISTQRWAYKPIVFDTPVKVLGYPPFSRVTSTDVQQSNNRDFLTAILTRVLEIEDSRLYSIPPVYMRTYRDAVQFFSTKRIESILQAYIGSRFYWNGIYNRYSSLAQWGESLIGRTVSVSNNNFRLTDVYYKGVDLYGSTPLKIVSWDYVQLARRNVPVHYTLTLELIHEESGTECTGNYTMNQFGRMNNRFYQRACKENTLQEDENGLLCYPYSYWQELFPHIASHRNTYMD